MNHRKIYRNMAKLGKIDMFYFDTKTPGETILCLHGLYGRAETWVDFINQYGSQYRIIAPDQRGHGLSSRPVSKYTAEEMAEDIVELLDFLHLDSVILVGHSMGGEIAGYLASAHPQSVKAAAILDKSASGPKEENPLPLNQFSTPDSVTQNWPVPFSSLHEAKRYIKQTAASDLEYDYFMNSVIETVEGYEMMFDPKAMAAWRFYYKSWYHLLPEITCKVLLIRSKGNLVVSDEDFEKMQSLLPNCMAREMSHPDHNVHLAEKEEFYKYFDEFLKAL